MYRLKDLDVMSYLTTQSLMAGILSLILIGIIQMYISLRPPAIPSNAPPRLNEGLSLKLSRDAIARPWDVFKRGLSLKSSRSGNFSFNIGHYPAVGLTSDFGRETFFNQSKLGFEAGYDAVMGAGDPHATTWPDTETHLNKRLRALLRTEWFVRGLPAMMSDINARLDELGSSGTTNPFYSIHAMIFQLTIRILGPREIAENGELRSHVQNLIETFDHNISPSTVIFPKLPSFGNIKKFWSGLRFYLILQSIVDDRKRKEKAENDPLQYLLDQNDTVSDIVGFIFGGFFAGVVNTGIIASWHLIQLTAHPEWLSKVRAEVAQMAARYAEDSSAPIHEQLLCVPLEAWESQLPILEMTLKETMRLNFLTPMVRRNITNDEIVVGDEVIPSRAIVYYHSNLVHMNPEIYPNPEVWDPERYTPERAEDKKVPHAWLGWGSGKHPCRGIRFAKLEQTMIFAFFVSRFDYDVLDAAGTKLEMSPWSGYRNFQLQQPEIYLRYNARV